MLHQARQSIQLLQNCDSHFGGGPQTPSQCGRDRLIDEIGLAPIANE
jgi:hypothetical protein